ncbi:unnamed protein product, partial [Ectocarpus sp. 13 AM-2016]
ARSGSRSPAPEGSRSFLRTSVIPLPATGVQGLPSPSPCLLLLSPLKLSRGLLNPGPSSSNSTGEPHAASTAGISAGRSSLTDGPAASGGRGDLLNAVGEA